VLPVGVEIYSWVGHRTATKARTAPIGVPANQVKPLRERPFLPFVAGWRASTPSSTPTFGLIATPRKGMFNEGRAGEPGFT